MREHALMGFISCAVGGLLGLAALGGDAMAAEYERKGELACYKWSAFPNERLKLNIEHHSRITEPLEERKFDHSRQTAFSVHGKDIGGCGGNTMAVVTGTIVTAKDRGAHMGIVAHYSRGDGVTDFCRSFTFDCTTSDDVPAPKRWQCQSRNEFDLYHGISELEKVDATEDERCSIFQNGSFTTARAQMPRNDLGQQSFAGSPQGILRDRVSNAGGGQSGGERLGIATLGQSGTESFLPRLRVDQGVFDEAVSCYSNHRANGVDDLTARFFCGLRPFPPWILEVDPRVLR